MYETHSNRSIKPPYSFEKKEHVEQLFGEGYELKVFQGTIAAWGVRGRGNCDDPYTKKSEIQHVRILGPIRSLTQVEISKTDSFALGVKAPIRSSGNIEGTPGITIIGPRGEMNVDHGVIIAERHIHMTTDDAAAFGVRDGQYVSVKVLGERGLIFFNQVLIRVKDTYALDMHIDTDEANAAGLKSGDTVELLL
ncbi:phosphate propanoyltransferase [Ectobacillus funiculus]